MYGYDVFHEAIMENLIDCVRKDASRHAYVFEGERGGGSYEAARLFAAALVCADREHAPCGFCSSCVMAAAKTHPDIYTVCPPEGKSGIPVDTIRTVYADAYTKPYESEKKVYIIAYGDEMNPQAQNAFLKLLEEPPEYAVFIILTENHESLLQTVLSRCVQIRFAPVSAEKIKRRLLERCPEIGEKADFYARYADGNPQRAEAVMNDADFIPLRAAAFDALAYILSPSLSDAYKTTEFLEENKDCADLILEFWQSFLRDVMLLQNGAKSCVANVDFTDGLRRYSASCTEKRITDALGEIIHAQKMRRRHVNLHALALRMSFMIKRKDR